MDAQLRDLKKDISVQNDKQNEKRVLKFSKESNRIQHEFNGDILRKLDIVSECLLDSRACEIVKELTKTVKRRNKLILIADSSPGGWATVREYEKPVIGSDGDDEKKLRQAESRAVKKFKTVKISQDKYVDKHHPYKPYSGSFTRPNEYNGRPGPSATFPYDAAFQPALSYIQTTSRS